MSFNYPSICGKIARQKQVNLAGTIDTFQKVEKGSREATV